MKATATTICVALLMYGGSAFAVVLNVPQDYPDIQAAIVAAGDEDVVVLAPVTHSGPGNYNVDFLGRAITVRSENPDDPQTVAATVIDCQGAGHAFVFRRAESPNSALVGLTLTGGRSYLGGAIYCSGSSSPLISKCVIVANSATFGGGAIACAGTASKPTIAHCHINANSAYLGGAIYLNGASPTLTGCVISGNYAQQGGAIYSHYPGTPALTNCTVAANAAAQRAGGIYCFRSSNAALVNTILWGDSAPYAAELLAGYSGAPTTVQVSYCDIQNSAETVVSETGCSVNWGQGNLSADPCFVDMVYPSGPATTPAGDYHLLAGSPCIDAGDPAFIAQPGEIDMDGNPRVQGVAVDMGAYELKPAVSTIAATVDFKPDVLNLNGHSKWVNCHISLTGGYDIAQVNVSTIKLNGWMQPAETTIDTYAQKLLAKFNRSQVETLFGEGDEAVTVVAAGSLLDGTTFEGTDTIGIRADSNGNKKGKK
jgi:predicted outer membrane repeat protein